MTDGALPPPASSSPLKSPLSTLWRDNLQDYFMTQVDPELSTIPLAAYCFMTGWMCAASIPMILYSMGDLLSP
jgi:hypothetical protein